MDNLAVIPLTQCLICEANLTALEIEAWQQLCTACMDKAVGTTALTIEELNDLPYGVITINEVGIIHSYNDWEQQLSGKAFSEVVGKNFFTEVAPCTRVKEFAGRYALFLNSDREVETFAVHFTFPNRPIRVNIAFVKRKDDRGMVTILVRKRG